MADEIDDRLPDAASRAAAQDGAPDAVIRHANQEGVEQPALAGRRQTRQVEQDDRVGERRPLHQRRDRVATNPNICRVRSCDRGTPGIHEVPDYTGGLRRAGGCYGSATVTT